ncbi:L-alanine-DL-glutamate epimerase-like enolase superfamily enzyme [Paralcaligenes ureilyticus]|uniref:L-alanine-DL-glutamate epimerase-like enolase superfamily enzyme n=1 Tax=Paralcaligenes ureilyticus TaxID=627131 RepID=A0A4R3LYF4_9BURK|nr:L-alanine-DL-glutamate epimerase-like enolase superfamily enzyme [Paralcaligenes ureilyticus]
MTRIAKATLRQLRLPLYRPYRLSYRTFTEFEPFFLELTDDHGRSAFSDAHVSPGSSSETRAGAWAYCLAKLNEINSDTLHGVKARLMYSLGESKVATTLLVTALEALERTGWLKVVERSEQELIVPISGTDQSEIELELETLFQNGFSTFKVKVGKDVQSDIKRTNTILKVLDGRGSIRLDANRAYSVGDAITFVNSITRSGVDLFEQPCDADAWDDNANVARNSPIPLMLDEPICSLRDIERASDIANVKYCKVKLKRFGSLDALAEGIELIHRNGMLAVLGDGLGSEINNWMEASVAARLIKTKGEFNGFLKHIDKLFKNPLPFANGRITLEKGYVPILDADVIERITVEKKVIEY